ncbi:MAG: bis(5'-nucleosyl)-tetraphosphatase (symmetrical) YqeK [Bacilli bacterium]|nr:bis(5'-nucleosyl)-tetraphosphatase (symmetrical) YqeK [Bacilli bacterium]
MKPLIEYERLLWEKYLSAGNPDIEERYRHSLAVKDKVLELITTFNLDIDKEKAAIAAILHDYAKFESLEGFKKIISKYQLDPKILEEDFGILHSLLAPYFLKEEVGIDDEEVLKAISEHTLGSLNMSKLSEVLFLADFTEDGREGVVFQEAKRLSKINFYEAIIAKINSRLAIYPDELSNKLYQKYRRLNANFRKCT